MLVHVIKPSGTRFQFTFADTVPDVKILSELERIKLRFGYNGTVTKPDPDAYNNPAEFADRDSGLVWDHPQTVVAVVRDSNGGVAEVRRLKGPPIPEPAPAA